MKSVLLQKIDYWRYLGFSKGELARYRQEVALDNLKVLRGALFFASIITISEAIFVFIFSTSNQGVTFSLRITGILLTIIEIFIILLTITYHIVKNKPNKVLHSRVLTTVFLSVWSLLYIIISTLIDPNDYAVLACGLLLLVQVVFNAYPIENLIFVLSVYIVFAIMAFLNKPIAVFAYDMIDALPFLLIGLFLSWEKSRSKWASLIHEDAMVNLEKQKLNNELLQSKIAVMLSQIQPHFLYNSLTAIHALCNIDPEKAREAIGDFSQYLRENLDSLKDEAPIPFAKELKHIQTYLKLEKMRFEEALQVVYDIQTKDFMIPALTIQPLVENAVKYGISQKEEGVIVTISTREYEGYYEINVSDNGAGFNMEEVLSDGRTHVGIENVKSRLWELSKATLDVRTKINEGTTAIITVRKEYEDEHFSDG